MSDLNQVTITGRLGADPEIRATQDGRKIANLRVAVGNQWRDKQTGERRERTEWVPVTIFSEGLAKIAEQYLRKGSRVLVQGAFQTRKWQDQSGADRYTTEVVLQNFGGVLTMLDGKQDGDQHKPGNSYVNEPVASGGGAADDFNDTVPF